MAVPATEAQSPSKSFFTIGERAQLILATTALAIIGTLASFFILYYGLKPSMPLGYKITLMYIGSCMGVVSLAAIISAIHVACKSEHTKDDAITPYILAGGLVVSPCLPCIVGSKASETIKNKCSSK